MMLLGALPAPKTDDQLWHETIDRWGIITPTQRPCQCEHVHHFEADPQGHAFYAIQPGIIDYKTLWGTYALCPWCFRNCHDSALDHA